MSEIKTKPAKKKKTNIRLGKETYGTMPIEECFRKAFEPYFDPDKKDDYFLNRFDS